MHTSFPNEEEKQLHRQYVVGDKIPKYPYDIEAYDPNKNRIVVGNRSRTLNEYSWAFTGEATGRDKHPDELKGLDERGIFHLFDYFLSKNGRVVWIDLGCGNGVALRQAKKHFKESGLGMERLIAIGYDLLPVDMFEYQYRRRESPKNYSDDDFNQEFEPTMLQENIRDAIFPETPDIVTCLQVLQWTEHPLEILANAAPQVPEGAFMNFSGLSRSVCHSDCGVLFHSSTGIRIRGFIIPKIDTFSGSLPEPSVMIRNGEPVSDFMFGLKRVGSRHEWNMFREEYRRDFCTYYAER